MRWPGLISFGLRRRTILALAGQVTIVTGASTGIGRCIALEVATQHARLCLVGRQLDKLESVAEEVRALGAEAHVFQADLASEPDILKTSQSIVDQFGHIDILIHCAGMISQGSVAETPVEVMDELYRVNFRAPYLLTHRLLPFLEHTGQIVFVNSTAGLTAKAGVSQYAASKHALKALADSLRQELSPIGIRVLTVYPARTATPMQEKIFQYEKRTYCPELLLQPERVARSVMHVLTMPRDSEITDLSIRGVTDMSVPHPKEIAAKPVTSTESPAGSPMLAKSVRQGH